MPAGGNTLEGAVRLALRVGPLGRMLRRHLWVRRLVIGDIQEAFAAHTVDGRVFLPSATWMASAGNP